MSQRKSYEIELNPDDVPHRGARGFLGQDSWIEAAFLFRFVVLAIGRRAGKTTFIIFTLNEKIAAHEGWYTAAYMAQGHAQAKEMFRACLEYWGNGGLVEDSRADEGQDRWIKLKPVNRCKGATIYFVSGEKGALPGFHGKGLNDAFLDEAALCPRAAWTGTLMPMLAGGGHGVILGAPFPEGEGFDWFEEAWKWGDVGGEGRDPEWLSFNAPTECNPCWTDEDIRQLRKGAANKEEEMCLYDGLFARDTGAVFTDLKTTFVLPVTEDHGNRWVHRRPKPGEPVVIGLDFGEAVKGDSTVASAISLDTFEQLEVMKFRGVKYEDQWPMIDDQYRRMGKNTIVVADGRAHGGYIVSNLRQRYGQSIQTVQWANGGQWDKGAAVHHGVHLCQATSRKKGWRLINLLEQREEFRVYGRCPLPSGGWRYTAPTGRHDDFVAANLLAAYRLPLVEPPLALEPEDPRKAKYDLSETPFGTVSHHEFMMACQTRDADDGVYRLH